MGQIIETTKLYINGEKVFPTSSDGIIADYSNAGWIPENVQKIKQNYDRLVNELKTTNIMENFYGDNPLVAYPDMQFSDYDSWNADSINITESYPISFKDDILRIKYVGRPYEHGIQIKNQPWLKELYIDNYATYVDWWWPMSNNDSLEKIEVNVTTLSAEDNIENRIMNFNDAFRENHQLKSIKMTWSGYPFYDSTSIGAMFYGCENLKTVDINFDFSNLHYGAIDALHVFEGCTSLETLPQITAFGYVINAYHLFYHAGWNYRYDTSKRTVDYSIDSLRNTNDYEAVNLEGMLCGCPLIKSLTINGEFKPSNANIFEFGAETGFNFDGAQAIYEENTSNIIGYYIPDVYTQNFFTTFKLYVHSDNVQWWKDELKNSTGGNSIINWYIDNGMVNAIE
jgi:hypothetical protein